MKPKLLFKKIKVQEKFYFAFFVPKVNKVRHRVPKYKVPEENSDLLILGLQSRFLKLRLFVMLDTLKTFKFI
jgi:hypothetical protein